MVVLDEEDAERFDRMVADGLKHPVSLRPTPKINDYHYIRKRLPVDVCDMSDERFRKE